MAENAKISRFMAKTLDKSAPFHNKQISPPSQTSPHYFMSIFSNILQRNAALGEQREREMLKSADTRPYKEVDGKEIVAHFFHPQKVGYPQPARPVVIFFHDGFWEKPMPSQFVPHCLHFADRGALAIVAETRTLASHGTGALEALEDARDFVRHIRKQATELNIDPQRVVLGGAGGGAFLALLCAMPTEKAMPPVDGLDCRPQALVLFSALVNTATKGQASERFPDAKTAKLHSPTQLKRRHLPPMLFFHGTADRVTPFAEVTKLCKSLRWRGNAVELVDFEKADHSFYNFNVSHEIFENTVAAIDNYLTEHNLLDSRNSEA